MELLLCFLTVLLLINFASVLAENRQLGYYNRFPIDYGTNNTERLSGRIRGILDPEVLEHESDHFFKWFGKRLVLGNEDETVVGRLKPFYAVDIGTKAELQGQNPKVVIINNNLETNLKGEIVTKNSLTHDFEVREIWQPWLKARCNFVVRYIIPNRINILKIMEAKGQVRSLVEVDNSKKTPEYTAKLILRPSNWISSLIQRKKTELIVPLSNWFRLSRHT